MVESPKYNRVLVKVSGESLSSNGFGIAPQAVENLTEEIIPLVKSGVQVAMVVGGGNFIRGRQLLSTPLIQRTTADSMGMLATVINGLALRDTFNSKGISAEIMSATAMTRFCKEFNRNEAVSLLKNGSIVIFAGGTGNPFFTTDTCASLRASEINADLLIKATKVDGVFDSDPEKNRDAKKYTTLSFAKIIEDRLGVMDLTAITMCMDSNISLIVLKLLKLGNLLKAINGEEVGTKVTQ